VRKRHDADGNMVSLAKLCRVEPLWAAHRIEALEAEVERLKLDRHEWKSRYARLWRACHPERR